MSTYSNPSIDPANYDSISGAFAAIFRKFIMQIDGALPARVIHYNRSTKRAQIQLSIAMVGTNGDIVPRGQIDNIPVVQWGGGKWILDFPIPNGTRGWLIACDRDISIFSQNGQDARPNTNRIKSFSDGFFIPDVFTDFTAAISGPDDFVIQNITGSVKLLFNENQITIKAPTVKIESTNITIDASSNVIINTPLFAVSGNITAGGTITPGVPPP